VTIFSSILVGVFEDEEAEPEFFSADVQPIAPRLSEAAKVPKTSDFARFMMSDRVYFGGA
jgi:hypothetical protein